MFPDGGEPYRLASTSPPARVASEPVAGPSVKAARGWRLLLSLAIAATFVWLMHAGALPLLPDSEALGNVRWWTFGAYLVGWSVVHLLRAGRWKLLLAPIADVPLRRVFVASFIGFLAIVALPMRTGEVVRPMLIREKGKLSAWAALGSLGAERIVDGLVLSLILFAALALATPLDPLPETLGELPIPVRVIPTLAYAALLAFGAALVAMLCFYAWKAPARRAVHWLLRWFSPRFAEWVAARIEGLAEGLTFLAHWRQGVPFLAMTAAYWLLNAACTWLLGWGCGIEGFGYAQACVVTGVLALGVLMPNAPGFIGAFQFSLYAALAMFYPREQVLVQGAAFVLLTYIAQTLITVVFAVWAAWFGGGSARAWIKSHLGWGARAQS